MDEAKIKMNPSPRGSGVRIVHNKLLGGWYIVRGPHQTPISGRFDTKAEAQAWLNRNKANPAARKKKMAAKKKTATWKKKATARKKIAVNAKSRATGKAPSARLKKRRARSTVPGAYPNPKARAKAVHVVSEDGNRIVYNYLIDDGGPILRFDSGNGFIERALLKEKGYKLRRGWPDKGKGAYPNPKARGWLIVSLNDRGDIYYFDGVSKGLRYFNDDVKVYPSRRAAMEAARKLAARITRPIAVVAANLSPQAIIDYMKPGKA